MKILKRWHTREFQIGDVSIALRLKALTKAEAVDYLRGLASIGRQARDVDPTDEEAVVAGLRRLQGEFVRDAFRRFVQLAEDVQVEDGGVIESGEALMDEIPTGTTFEILLAIQNLCVATETQGKASGSPSTSSPGGSEPDRSGSDVTSTSGGDGTAPSTVARIPPNGGASTGLV